MNTQQHIQRAHQALADLKRHMAHDNLAQRFAPDIERIKAKADELHERCTQAINLPKTEETR